MGFVFTFSKLLKIKEKIFINSMNSFKGLPHRFEIFLKKNNISFINDQKQHHSRHPCQLYKSLKNIYWILGGLPKKKDKINLSSCKQNISKCYLIGKNIQFFKNQIRGKIPFAETKNLKNSIIQILKDCKTNKIIITNLSFLVRLQRHLTNLLILKVEEKNLKTK